MTIDIDTFLTARYDEMQALAEAAIPCSQNFDWEPSGSWRADDMGKVTDTEGHIVVYDEGSPSAEQAAHIAFHDPVFALADVAAKRATLAAVAKWKHDYNDEDPWFSCAQAVDPTEPNAEPGSGCTRNGDDEPMPCDCGLDLRRWQILGPLGAPFAGHSDFDPEWSVRP